MYETSVCGRRGFPRPHNILPWMQSKTYYHGCNDVHDVQVDKLRISKGKSPLRHTVNIREQRMTVPTACLVNMGPMVDELRYRMTLVGGGDGAIPPPSAPRSTNKKTYATLPSI